MVFPVSSQEQIDVIVHSDFDRTDEFKWSANSTQFTFYNYDLGSTEAPLRVITDSPGWQTIDLSTRSLTTGSNIWPLQPNLMDTQQNVFMPYGFVYTSPNTNLLIFGQEPSDDLARRDLVIANRNTLQVVSLGKRAISDTFRPNSFNVQWSDDGHAAVVAFADLSDALQIIHVDIPDFDNLQNVVVREFEPDISGIPYDITAASEDDFLDLSGDGQAVLVIARDSTSNEVTTFYDHPPALVIWRPYTNDATIVGGDILIEENFSAAFAPDSTSTIFVANSQGLFFHNSGANVTRQLLTSERVANWFKSFSPDGRWLAIVKYETIEIVSLQTLMGQPRET
jgi:Tol biopolymer transport system component